MRAARREGTVDGMAFTGLNSPGYGNVGSGRPSSQRVIGDWDFLARNSPRVRHSESRHRCLVVEFRILHKGRAYLKRSARIGSTRAARRAGIQSATARDGHH